MRNLKIWKRYVQYYKGYYKCLLGNLILSTFRPVFVILTLVMIKKIFDEALPNESVYQLGYLSLLIIGCQAINFFIEGFTRFHNIKIDKKVNFLVRKDLLAAYYGWTYPTFHQADKHKLHSVFIHDTHRIDVMAGNFISFIFPAAAIILGLLAYLLWVFPLAVGLLILVCVKVVIIDLYWRPKMSSTAKYFHRCTESLAKDLKLGLDKMRLSKIKAISDFMLQQHLQVTKHFLKTGFKLAWVFQIRGLLQNTLLFVFNIIILFVFGVLVIKGQLSLGEFVSFYAILAFIRTYGNIILIKSPLIIEGYEALLSYFNLLDVSSPISYQGTQQVTFQRQIILSNVYFKYKQEWILRDINLRINRGEIIAIIGENGSGKSTLAKLLSGLYPPQRGKITIDNQDLKDIDLNHFRKGIGVLFQEELLFEGTIAENIAFGALKATEGEIMQAARIASADEFIRTLPEGYQTEVGELGNRLSGGQKQRIALARTLIHQPTLLILDEPTNHLDANTINYLLENIQQLENYPAILIISHDKQIHRFVDRAYRLESKEIEVIEEIRYKV